MIHTGRLAALALLPMLAAPMALAQPAPRGGAAPHSQYAAPAVRGGTVLAQPVARPVPGVLSDAPPPRYDSLALGHAQFANQPPPRLDRPRGRDMRDEDGLRANSNGYGNSGYGNGGYANGAYGAGAYPVPYPAEGGGARPRPVPFGSSASVDGD